jgi:membrane-associated phospholipid phosphatase
MAKRRRSTDEKLDILDGVTLAVGMAMFALVSVLVRKHRTSKLDRFEMRRRAGNSDTTRAASVLTRVLSPAGFGVIAAVIAAWLRREGRHDASGAVVGSGALSLLSEEALKLLLPRRRPPQSWFVRSSDLSYPSGHTVSATAVSDVLAYVLVREKLISGEAALAIAVAPPLIVGSTRIYLGRHWPTDVLGGWLMGIALSGMTALGYEMAKDRPHEH